MDLPRKLRDDMPMGMMMGRGGMGGMGGMGGNPMSGVLPPQLAAQGVQQGPSGVGTAPARQGPPNANLFVYNIPTSVTDVDLYVAFASFGAVLSAKVFVDKATGQSKGFGFVNFSNEAIAAQAIHAMNGYVWAGRRLRVSVKTARGQAAPY